MCRRGSNIPPTTSTRLSGEPPTSFPFSRLPAYRDDVTKLIRTLGIRRVDLGVTAVVAAAVELNVIVATGPRQVRLDALALVLGVVVALPLLLRRRWPFGVLIACSVLLLIFYSVHGNGLVGMAERAAQVGGEVTARLPLIHTDMARLPPVTSKSSKVMIARTHR